MFSSNHEIYKFAWAGDELDDWLPYAEELVNKWNTDEEVIFDSSWDIILASLLLMDDLLPPAARKSIAKILLETIADARDRKIRISALKIELPPPGRKKDRYLQASRHREVDKLIDEGLSKTDAYIKVGEKHNKSADTIRRSYERMIKNRQENKREN